LAKLPTSHGLHDLDPHDGTDLGHELLDGGGHAEVLVSHGVGHGRGHGGGRDAEAHAGHGEGGGDER
jgi:hypothetical protein